MCSRQVLLNSLLMPLGLRCLSTCTTGQIGTGTCPRTGNWGSCCYLRYFPWTHNLPLVPWSFSEILCFPVWLLREWIEPMGVTNPYSPLPHRDYKYKQLERSGGSRPCIPRLSWPAYVDIKGWPPSCTFPSPLQ